MSGPIPHPEAHNGVGREPAATDDIKPEQWRALGRLADQFVRLEEAAGGSLGTVLTDRIRDLSHANTDYDIGALSQDLLGMLRALSQNGVLQAITDNTAYVAQSVRTVSENPESLAAIAASTVKGLRNDVQLLHGLAERLRAVQGLLDGPTGAAVTKALAKVSAAYTRYDLSSIGTELAETVQALAQSGLLTLIRDNAAYLKDTTDQLVNLDPDLLKWWGVLRDTIREDLMLAHKAADLARQAQIFLDGPGGTVVTEFLTKASRAFAEHDLGGLGTELVDLLVAWRDMGLFPVLRDATTGLMTIAHTWHQSDVDPLLPRLLKHLQMLDMRGLQEAWHQAHATLDAVKTTHDKATHPPQGGVKGLYTLLTDPDVQEGLWKATLVIRHIVPPRNNTAER
ncbi:MAG: helical membrane plugin domain-containing protein [Acidiferrobacteraceae bacterium]